MTASVRGTRTDLVASDGFKLSGYLAMPAGPPRGAIVVVQEIFGVNAHVRAVCDGFAGDGYAAIAPAVFDRIEPGVELGYDDADIARGRVFKAKADASAALRDITAARDAVAPHGRVGVVGYCWGGYLAWLAACRVEGLAAAVVYYGGGIGDVIDQMPRCPVLGHFGAHDAMIPLSAIDEWRARHPSHPVHVYDAGHGFNCDHRGSYDEGAAALARERTLEFFRQHLG